MSASTHPSQTQPSFFGPENRVPKTRRFAPRLIVSTKALAVFRAISTLENTGFCCVVACSVLCLCDLACGITAIGCGISVSPFSHDKLPKKNIDVVRILPTIKPSTPTKNGSTYLKLNKPCLIQRRKFYIKC
ncbi:MAG: hypothetical protein LiPW30_557 [Parcubacteria group bacterium LiPW_30]|nr:MAG: hypothetical protein LiPW30_557 [Parcubacteria group bacterium LiPW_30]